jgi:hypothetical protein
MRNVLFAPALLSALLLCPACASTSVVHGRALASAGAAYGKASDLLLQATQEAAVDADSARLLSEGQGLSRDERRALLARHAPVSQTIADLSRLRRHARLLTRYFEALGRLAGARADTEAGDAAGDAAAALTHLGTELTGSTLLDAGERDTISQLARLTVQTVSRSAFERELSTRGPAIDREIEIQKTLLDAVRRKLRADLDSAAALGSERDVTRPFVENAVLDPRAWIGLRRAYLLVPPSTDALKSASNAASKLRAAWREWVSGRFDEAALRELAADIETVVAFAETLKKVMSDK